MSAGALVRRSASTSYAQWSNSGSNQMTATERTSIPALLPGNLVSAPLATRISI